MSPRRPRKGGSCPRMRKRRSSAAIPASNNTSTTTTKPPSYEAAGDESACDDAADYERTYAYDYNDADPAAAWSAWDAVVYHPGRSSSTRQVETKVETETVLVPVYHYSRWHYYNTGYNKWYYSYAEYTGSNYKPGTGNWEYMSTMSHFSKNGTADGHQQL